MLKSMLLRSVKDSLKKKFELGELVLPDGVAYEFAGNYENQVRSQRTLMLILPIALFVIFIILYLQFRSVVTASLVFSGIGVAWSGGFLLLWFYAQPWFFGFHGIWHRYALSVSGPYDQS